MVRTSLIALVLLAVSLRAETPAPAGVELRGPSETRRVTAADLAAMPHVKVTVSDHGTEATFEGVPLVQLLALVGAPSGEKLRGPELLKYVLVEAADAYRVLFALAELDPKYTDRQVILADKRDGKPLSEKEGPFRVIVQGEKRMARCARQVTRISVGTVQP